MREKLLLQEDTLTLSSAVNMAFQIESAAACAAKLATSKTCDPPPFHASAQSGQPDSLATDDVQLAQQSRAQSHQRCGNCGSASHATRALNWPARGQMCRDCEKQNHFAIVCRSAPATTPAQRRPQQSHSGSTVIQNVTARAVASSCGKMSPGTGPPPAPRLSTALKSS